MVSALALPPNRIIASIPPERYKSLLADHINTAQPQHLNPNTQQATVRSIPGRLSAAQTLLHRDGSRRRSSIKCGNKVDCRRAICRVTRGGDALQPQLWTSQVGRLSRSGGIFDAPGGSYACVIFPRIDVAGDCPGDIAEVCE